MAGVATPGSGGVQGVVSIPVISRGAPADVRGSPKSFRRISVGIGNGIHHAGDVLRPVPQIPGLRWQRLGSYRTPHGRHSVTEAKRPASTCVSGISHAATPANAQSWNVNERAPRRPLLVPHPTSPSLRNSPRFEFLTCAPQSRAS